MTKEAEPARGKKGRASSGNYLSSVGGKKRRGPSTPNK